MKQRTELPPRRSQANVKAAVSEIYASVRKDGDAAVRAYAQQFDDFQGDFWLQEWNTAIEPELAAAIDGNFARIKAFHQAQIGEEFVMETAPGLTLGRRAVPYPSVACYVPGGRASYPSTVLMTVTLAALAGVQNIIVVTPNPTPSVLYAAKAAGATRVLQLGGAHAIAALALGTESIPRVDAIVGPGNAYVTEAKRMADCHKDAPAGPSELLVLADDTANPDEIVWDLLAQAEHDPDAEVLLLTPSQSLADQVMAGLQAEAPNCARASIIQQSLQNATCIVAPWEDCIQLTNQYAPEHLEIMCENARSILPLIQNAGSIFLGSTPVSLGDYGSGTNHVLPTMGQARLRGGLCVDDFRKWITWQEATPEGLTAVASDIARLAEEEGLQMHAQAVRRRL